jgi:hypothetical protein
MNPGASSFRWPARERPEDRGIASALAIAILFVAVAAASFAVDQSLTLSNLPLPPASSSDR